jgi:hypothetical protein
MISFTLKSSHHKNAATRIHTHSGQIALRMYNSTVLKHL